MINFIVLCLIAGTTKLAESTIKDCSCTTFVNHNGFGQCQKGVSQIFKGRVFCYVRLPSLCNDRFESKTSPGKWVSADACKSTSTPQPDKDDAEIQVYFQLNEQGNVVCNATTACPPKNDGPRSCQFEEREGRQVYACRTNQYEYDCDSQASLCTEFVCEIICYRGERKHSQSLQMINGSSYGCVTECQHPPREGCAEEQCPHVAGAVFSVESSSTAAQSVLTLSRNRCTCPQGTCKRKNRCCPVAFDFRRKIFVCPHFCF